MTEKRYDVEIFEFNTGNTVKIIGKNMNYKRAEARRDSIFGQINHNRYRIRIVEINDKKTMTHHTMQSLTIEIEQINKIINKEKIEYKIKVSPFLKRKRLLKKYLYNKMKII